MLLSNQWGWTDACRGWIRGEKSLSATKCLFKDLSPFILWREVLQRGPWIYTTSKWPNWSQYMWGSPKFHNSVKTSQICMSGNCYFKYCAHMCSRIQIPAPSCGSQSCEFGKRLRGREGTWGAAAEQTALHSTSIPGVLHELGPRVLSSAMGSGDFSDASHGLPWTPKRIYYCV